MTGPTNTTPAASWGTVAKEVAKHPIKAGVDFLALGALDIGLGVAVRDPLLGALGVGLETLGGMRMRRFANGLRHPTLH